MNYMLVCILNMLLFIFFKKSKLKSGANLHAGTFTKEGTFKAVQSKLEYLKNELGITMIELLPLADWPGRWNWGYDGVG